MIILKIYSKIEKEERRLKMLYSDKIINVHVKEQLISRGEELCDILIRLYTAYPYCSYNVL